MSRYSSFWTPLPSLPDPEGFAGMYAGTCGEIMICAGGTNFPEKPMLEGGAKTWTDRIFTLSPGGNEWKEAGTLPVPYAYGASAGIREGLLCIGGCGEEGHRKDVYLLNAVDGTVAAHPFPSLPIALAYTAAAVLDGKVYLTGGCERPGEQDCTNRVFMLDTSRPEQGWQEQDPLPGRGRFLHQMAATGGALYVLGGIGLREQEGKQVRELLKEAWSYTPEHGWTRLPDMPYAIAAAPTPAPVSGNGVIYLLGGDDGSGKKYTPQTNPGFNNQSLCLDTADMTWHDAGPIAAPRAVLPCCAWQGRFAIVNGELKPGRRSPEIWSISLP
ncbi:hypothetical protein [Akkermansia sp.]|uniref:hypothetical protein n=1 Tax=Akkermansia sp. TaxID=1872421 RepID=UPI003AB56733